MKFKILGFDPSLSNFGVAKATLDTDTMTIVVDGLSLIQTVNEQDRKLKKVVRKNSEDLERAKLLHKGAMEAIEGHWLAFIEVPVGSQSARAMASYGICIGVLAAVGRAIPMIQVTPNEVKMIACGTKTATKDEMIEAMMKKHPNAPWPTKVVKGVRTPIASQCEHMADAVAAIEAGMATDEFRQMIAMYKSTPMFHNAMARDLA